MSEFLKVRKARNALGTGAYVALNLALAVGSTVVTMISGSWIIGVLLVILSKWRMFAVRPRYWFINVKSNLVDIIVGVSMVLLVYFAGTELRVAHAVLTAVYAVWLLVIKPRSSEIMTEIQSLFAVFFGLAAAGIATASIDSVALVVAGFIIGYGASRHVLTQSDDHDFVIITFVSGLLLAEVCFVLSHWMIMYSFFDTGIVVPQLAIVGTLVSLLFYRVYKSIVRHDGQMKGSEVLLPVIFVCLIILIMAIGFSEPVFDI